MKGLLMLYCGALAAALPLLFAAVCWREGGAGWLVVALEFAVFGAVYGAVCDFWLNRRER